ncbi:MraY family glycosyltransferase [Hypericibacter sp.]|uniref:MraY family glycosyltransferase n=1 Tax=Hypericibacter sp. TaxID=2705401 RepID=UPI003D6C8ED1
MTVTTMALLFAGSFLASLLFCGWARLYLLRRRVLDRPVERSVHLVPTPRGAGLAVVPILTLLWLFLPAFDPGAMALPRMLVIGTILVSIVSWIDDLFGLPALPRLGVQVLAVVLGLVALAQLPPVFQGWLPRPLDLALSGLLWLWFVNLFNFMDGSDTVAGGQALTVGLGLAAIAIDQGWVTGLTAAQGLTLAGVALGFLFWNRPPAKIFLGDVGSIPLGYLIGWLLLWASSQGAWAAALILPAWFFADTTITLVKRAWRCAPLLEAHAEHSNSVAIKLGHSQARVAGLALVANGALALLALGAERDQQALGLLGAAATVWLLMRKLKHPPKPPPVPVE